MYMEISEGMSGSLLGHERVRLSGRYRTQCVLIYQLVRLGRGHWITPATAQTRNLGILPRLLGNTPSHGETLTLIPLRMPLDRRRNSCRPRP